MCSESAAVDGRLRTSPAHRSARCRRTRGGQRQSGALLLRQAGRDRTVAGDLSFSTTAALPPKSIRTTNVARFQARLGTQRSLKLKFARRMTQTVARRLSTTSVRIGGRVTGPLAQPVAGVRISREVTVPGRTSFRGAIVARGIGVGSRGRWTARVALPPSLHGTRMFLRAETRVRKTKRNPKRFATFSLIQGVTLK